jgi:hypothetical protein
VGNPAEETYRYPNQIFLSRTLNMAGRMSTRLVQPCTYNLAHRPTQEFPLATPHSKYATYKSRSQECYGKAFCFTPTTRSGRSTMNFFARPTAR